METVQSPTNLIRILLPEDTVHMLAVEVLCFLSTHPNQDFELEKSRRKMESIVTIVDDALHDPRGSEVKPHLLARIITCAYFNERQGLDCLLAGLRNIQKEDVKETVMTNMAWTMGCLLGGLAVLAGIARDRVLLEKEAEGISDFILYALNDCKSACFGPKEGELLSVAMKEFLVEAKRDRHGLRTLLYKLAECTASGPDQAPLACCFAVDLMHKILSFHIEMGEALAMFDSHLT